jgi:hypothetical protein
MTKLPCQSLLGAAIVFGSVKARALVRNDNTHRATFQDVRLRPSRKRTLSSKEHSGSSLFLPLKPVYGFFRIGILQSQHQHIESSFEDLLQFELLSSISTVPEEDWDRCLCSESSPFLEHSWLRCLEEAGCATVDTGWMPSHVLIRMDDRVCGFVPVTIAWVEGGSSVEFLQLTRLSFYRDPISCMLRAIQSGNSFSMTSGQMQPTPTTYGTIRSC